MQETIKGMEPIIPPESVSFWTPQPGWYFVLVLVLGLFGYVVYAYFQYRKRNKYRRIALIELTKLENQPDPAALLPLLNRILKATALAGYPRDEVASLHGKPWLEFLDRTESSCSYTTKGELLADTVYREPTSVEIDAQTFQELLEMGNIWIKKHRTK